MKDLRRIELYIKTLKERALEWEQLAGGNASCVFCDLWFAGEWLRIKDGAWAWGCVQNARNLARELGIMRTARA